jgi:hemolysin (HlyC) family protein
MRTIVVASDAPSVRAEITGVIGEPGTDVLEVTSGSEVAPSVAEHDPDLVVLDLQMGNMGAMAVCLDLRLADPTGHLGAAGRRLLPRRVVPAGAGAGPAPGQGLTRAASMRYRRSAHERPPDRRSSPGEGAGGDQEQIILAALAELRDTPVREVMTPRVDVVGLPIPVRAEDVARAARRSGHSAFPVYDDDLDNLVGVLFVNDLFRSGWQMQGDGSTTSPETPSPVEISRRLRQPLMVPESRLVLEVLADMRSNRRAFAVVVDEYGGVAGVLTVKDLLSALVGDLRDEMDAAEEPGIVRVDQTRWLVDGGVGIDELEEALGLALPEGEYVTLGGFLFDAFGHIPEEGERLEQNGWELRVAEMDRRRVAKVVAAMKERTAGENGSG